MADIVYSGAAPTSVVNREALPDNVDIIIYKGDDLEFTITIKTPLNTAVDLTGSIPKAYLKTSYNDQFPITFTTAISGSPSLGVVSVSLTSAVTKTLIPGAYYIWDFQITGSTSKVRTYASGDVTVYDEVTDG